MKYLNLFFIISLLFFVQSIALPQSLLVNYSYDGAGNRTSRVNLPLDAPPPPGGESKDTISDNEISVYECMMMK